MAAERYGLFKNTPIGFLLPSRRADSVLTMGKLRYGFIKNKPIGFIK